MDSDVVRLQKQWRNFSADRSKAKRLLQEKVDLRTAQIEQLREENIRDTTEFTEYWKTRKEQIQQERDEAVMAELATGRSAQSILRDLGSNNTVWIYDLRARVQATRGIPEQENLNTYNPPEERQQQTQQQAAQRELAEEPAQQIQVLPGVRWLHHDHAGVVGWLLSDDHQYIKKHGMAGTDFEGDWFICDRSHNLIAGSLELFDATPKGEVTRRSKMLEQLLKGEFTGKLRPTENPYTS